MALTPEERAPEVVAPLPEARRPVREWHPSGKALENIANMVELPSLPIVDVKDPFSKPIGIMPPKTLWEARISPWWKEYRAAAQKEYDGHLKSGTWLVVPRETVPPGKNILRGKWVFDDKRDQLGKIVKFKARFVAMGCTQRAGEDYGETFAGVVVGKSFRTMLAFLAIDPEMEIEHWDVRMAFTQAPLADELWMEEPEEFTTPKKGMVLKLLKSLYGLKQAAHNWAIFLREIIFTVGLKAIFSDPCVYKAHNEEAFALVCTHVDDIFVLFNQKGGN
jgi:hypothetical protein